jgi:DNA-binding response OmpR family regulator
LTTPAGRLVAAVVARFDVLIRGLKGVDPDDGQEGPANVSVLLIEDDRGIAGLYRQRLDLEGYAVTVAADGESALAAVAGSVPDLILLDVRLPGLGGLEVLERLKKDRRTRQVPVLILTNWDDEEVRAQARKLGAHEYLVKSEVRPGELAGRIRDMLASRDGQAGAARDTEGARTRSRAD